MRYVIGLLCGILGALAGWFGLAMLVIALAGHDRDGGIAMGAFFHIGPVGAVIGFILGVLIFIKLGQNETTGQDGARHRRIAPLFAVVVIGITALLGYSGWYTLIRSPYLSHGFMTLTMQFRLPPGVAVPASPGEVHISVYEGDGETDVIMGPKWSGKDGAADVIFAATTLSMKTNHRVIALKLPGIDAEKWTPDLVTDPDPMSALSPWQMPDGNPANPVQLRYRLTADR
jgi:hypothetical protein